VRIWLHLQTAAIIALGAALVVVGIKARGAAEAIDVIATEQRSRSKAISIFQEWKDNFGDKTPADVYEKVGSVEAKLDKLLGNNGEGRGNGNEATQ
jgi:hypothetical protein